MEKNKINENYLKIEKYLNNYSLNILKTNDRRRFHDQICKELFKQLGWNFNCIF